jgi:DNA mismatch endonuclease (patch repair protein)
VPTAREIVGRKLGTKAMGKPRSTRPSSVPTATDLSVRLRMCSTGRRDTAAEVALRWELHRSGLRYRVDRSVLNDRRRRVDVVFPRERIAVFVDGCFWHSCPLHATVPKANREWWVKKLAANRRRDRNTNETLSAAGWTVVRVWEHEDAAEAASRVRRLVLKRRDESQRKRRRH